MQISGFPGAQIEITDLETLIKSRLINGEVVWPDQAAPLVGYIAWPSHETKRKSWIDAHRRSDQSAIETLGRKLKNTQQHWARVADIIHLHSDLANGGHQGARAGASVGKAISLISANAKSKGTRAAKLWEIWATYKDVAHLITAAVLVSAEVQTRHRRAPFGLRLHQFQPYRMAMLLPELAIAVAMTIEKYGLESIPYGRMKPLFNPESLWRIPLDINVAPLTLPIRMITKRDLAVLNARRAGNRGSANRRKTTPVLA
jgi:hypothetical protein